MKTLTIVSISLLLGAACSGPLPDASCSDCQVTAIARAATIISAPFADAYVRDGASAGTNYGASATLEVKAQSGTGNNRYVYLRFPISSINGNITLAKLRLHGSRPSANGVTDGVFEVTDNSWSESGINWNNKPALGAPQGTAIAITPTVQYYEWNITSYVAARKAAGASVISLAVKMNTQVSIGPDVFSSREATNYPKLEVTTADASQPPTVATAAAASPNPTTSATSALSVLGADDGGEPALTYTWAKTSGPSGMVSFSPNGNNAAKNSTATFTQPGTYGLQATIRDADNQFITSSVTVTVNLGVGSLVMSPASATIPPRASQQLTVTARDQFGGYLNQVPSLTWSAPSGGTVTSGGLFTAPASGGPFTVTATGAGLNASATISLSSATQVLTFNPVADANVRDGTNANTNYGAATKLEVKAQSGSGNNRIAYLRFPITGVGGVMTAKLRLYGNRPSASGVPDSVFGVDDIWWSESFITWNNRPTLAATAQGPGTVIGTTLQYYEWDVTPWIEGQRNSGRTEVSLAVKMNANVTIGPDSFNSRESTSNRPQLVVQSGTCSFLDGCACPLGSAGGTCASCAAGYQSAGPGVCTLINDAPHTEWPNATSKANGDPWLVAHHGDLQVIKPKLMVLDYVNFTCNGGGDNCTHPVTFEQTTAFVNTIVDGFTQGSKPQGWKTPGATAQLQYQTTIRNLRDGSGQANSALLPRRPPGEPGGLRVDLKKLFAPEYAVNYGVPDPDQPGQYLPLCELVNRGLVHEVWLVGAGDGADVGLQETLGMAPYYTSTGNPVPGLWNMCTGNGCFDADVPSCGRSLRIGGINHSRGPGCFIHGQGHGIEWTAHSPVNAVQALPALREWFLPFAGFDLDTRWGLPFNNFYAVGCPGPGPCVSYPSPTHLVVARPEATYDIDPFDPVCGNVHWSPNSIGDYDNYADRQVLSSCTGFARHQGPGGSDATEIVNQDSWMPYFSPQFGDCGGEYVVWWYQNMPAYGTGQTFKDGRPMKAVWPFLYY